jgi:hypothetical protein
MLRASESDGPPDPKACRSQDDEGKLHHDVLADIWYECILDDRRRAYTWVILPPDDAVGGP